MNIRQKLIISAVAAATLAANIAFADPHGSREGHGMGGSHHSATHGNPAAMVEGHLAALKVELKITADQEQAWKAFTDTARKQAEGMPARHEQMRARMKADTPAPEQLAQRTAFAKQHIATMETMTAAVKELYGALTPEQKKTADRVLARGPMGGFGGGGGRGHHSHG